MLDRIVRGGIAGMLGQVAIMAVNIPSKLLFRFSRHLWVEYTAAVFVGHPPRGLPETLMAFVVVFIFAGIVGGAFSVFMVLFPDRRSYLLRGMGWAYTVWLITFGLGNMSKLPLFQSIDWPTAFTQFLAITAYGLVVGLLTQRWDKAVGYPETLVAQKPLSPDKRDELIAALNRLSDTLAKSQPGSAPAVSGIKPAEPAHEFAAEFGRLETKLELIADRLESGDADEPLEGQQTSSWESVEHLGFHVLEPSDPQES